jgi:hypothetical protein
MSCSPSTGLRDYINKGIWSSRMTLYERFDLIVSAAGFLGLVVSIGILIAQTHQVALQSRSSARALESNAFDASAAATFKIDSIFTENSDLRKYFYDSEVPPHPDRDRVLAVAELLLDYFDYVLLQQQRPGLRHPHNFWSEQYLIDLFSESHILCEYLEQRKSWFSDELTAVMNQGMERRRERLAHASTKSSPQSTA